MSSFCLRVSGKVQEGRGIIRYNLILIVYSLTLCIENFEIVEYGHFPSNENKSIQVQKTTGWTGTVGVQVPVAAATVYLLNSNNEIIIT